MGKQENRLVSLMIEAAPHVYELMVSVLGGNRSVLTVSNTEQYLFGAFGKDLDLGIRAGSPVKEGSGARTCMERGEVVFKKMDSTIYGVPYMVHSVPLIENGKIVGSMNAGINTQKQEVVKETLLGAAANLETFSADIFDIMRTISGKSGDLRELGQEMAAEAVASNEKVELTTEFITSINNIASQIGTLGINAAIQAARSQHKGFAIIAGEIRRLSEGTKGFVDQILPFLFDLKARSATIGDKSDSISTQSKDLSKTADEVLNSLNKLTKMVEEMKSQSMQL